MTDTPGQQAPADGSSLPDEVPDLLQRLNDAWRVAGPPPAAGTLKSTLLHTVRRMLARLLLPQEVFNATVVRYLNASSQERGDVLSAHDEVRRYHALLAARERRMADGMGQLEQSQRELQTAVGALQHALRHVEREMARTAAPTAPTQTAGTAAAGAAPAGVAQTAAGSPVAGQTGTAPAGAAAPGADTPGGSLGGHTYVGFEDQFRGDPAEIRARLADYVPLFAGASDVLDIGCGRGELLALLAEAGTGARGIDLNPSMVDVCRERGLAAETADALTYLRNLSDGALGGLFAAQVVEHLEPAYLTRLLDVAFDRLRPGALLVLETINPACWFAFFESYLRDLTHVRPIHPETLQYLLVARGFQQVEIRYRAPYPDADKLQPVPGGPDPQLLPGWAGTLNANVEKLNGLLFTYLDYAVVARRP
ncbi:MAG: class I SAM-dependent methyltransferase [Vicinamibacterales bacterium]